MAPVHTQFGTFTSARHSYRKTSKAKHNPLQRLAYLFLKLMVSPVSWVSGLLYLFYSQWPEALSNVLSLQAVANVHTITAFAMMVFIIGHVYMTTLDHTLFSHIKPMVTGYDTVDQPGKKSCRANSTP
jgi:thiosulfate reductase cytochrome b subunit